MKIELQWRISFREIQGYYGKYCAKARSNLWDPYWLPKNHQPTLMLWFCMLTWKPFNDCRRTNPRQVLQRDKLFYKRRHFITGMQRHVHNNFLQWLGNYIICNMSFIMISSNNIQLTNLWRWQGMHVKQKNNDLILLTDRGNKLIAADQKKKYSAASINLE